MPNCKVCDKQFHACGSCDLQSWEWNYCSFTCYKEGSKDVREEMDKFLSQLTPEMTKQLNYFIEDWEELFWSKLDEAINGSK